MQNTFNSLLIIASKITAGNNLSSLGQHPRGFLL